MIETLMAGGSSRAMEKSGRRSSNARRQHDSSPWRDLERQAAKTAWEKPASGRMGSMQAIKEPASQREILGRKTSEFMTPLRQKAANEKFRSR